MSLFDSPIMALQCIIQSLSENVESQGGGLGSFGIETKLSKSN
jgi:hypothetical protein